MLSLLLGGCWVIQLILRLIWLDVGLQLIVHPVVWVAIIGVIWRHRNNHIIKGGTIDHFEIFSLAQLKTWS